MELTSTLTTYSRRLWLSLSARAKAGCGGRGREEGRRRQAACQEDVNGAHTDGQRVLESWGAWKHWVLDTLGARDIWC
eukprot:366384-Chlamydomonas_euryale.AAC.12